MAVASTPVPVPAPARRVGRPSHLQRDGPCNRRGSGLQLPRQLKDAVIRLSSGSVIAKVSKIQLWIAQRHGAQHSRGTMIRRQCHQLGSSSGTFFNSSTVGPDGGAPKTHAKISCADAR